MSTPALEQPVPPEQALAWEASQRQRSGLAGVIAAVLTLAGSIGLGLISADQPHVLAVTALQDAVGERPANAPGLRTETLLFLNDHAVALILATLVVAIGSLLMVPILGFLHRAAAARSARATKIALYAALIGPIAVAVGGLIVQIAATVQISDFASSSDHSTTAAHDVLGGPLIVSMSILRSLGGLTVALAFILVSLNAMRVGLLTRFMGMLGIIAGALVLVGPLVAPQLAALPIIEIFWLLAVGCLVLGRWPGGKIPPAWSTGKPEPWPTQQQLREERQRELARRKSESDARRDEDDEPAIDEAPAPMPVPRGDEDAPAGTVHPSSKKRKRKRR